MLQAFSQIAKNVKLKAKLVYADNLVFQLHYRYTVWLLLACTVLVSSRQYIGEHIRCISDTIPTNVMNSYCFFTTTFTVVRHLNGTQAPHPGIGPLDRGPVEEPIIKHAYYQWVPFVLTLQAILFYLPHRLWRAMENGTIKMLVTGLEHSYLALRDQEIPTRFGTVPSKKGVQSKMFEIRTTFSSRLIINKYWGYKLLLCESLNGVNLLLQWIMTDAFLGGRFLDLGSSVTRPQAYDGEPDPLDVVFPKVTKCLFYKYGASGTIQRHDAMCVMALNVINEKIYTFLWFWFIFLSVVSALGMLWRILTILVVCRNVHLSMMVFRTLGRIEQKSFHTVMRHCDFSHWLFLYYLAKNMHGWATNDLFNDLAAEIEEQNKEAGISPGSSSPTSSVSGGYGDNNRLLQQPLSLDEPDSVDKSANSRPHRD